MSRHPIYTIEVDPPEMNVMKTDTGNHLRLPVWKKKAKSFLQFDRCYSVTAIKELVSLMAEEYRAGQEIEVEMRKAKRDSRFDEN